MKNEIDEKKRDKWLRGIEELAGLVIRRDSLLFDCSPQNTIRSYLEKVEARNKAETMTVEISRTVEKLRKLEKGEFGVTAVVPALFCGEEMALMIYLLVAIKLNPRHAHLFENLSDYVRMIAGGNIVKALRCRNLVRDDSLLVNGRVIGRSTGEVTLDECKLILREKAFNKAVGNPEDQTACELEGEFRCSPYWK